MIYVYKRSKIFSKEFSTYLENYKLTHDRHNGFHHQRSTTVLVIFVTQIHETSLHSITCEIMNSKSLVDITFETNLRCHKHVTSLAILG